VIPGSISASAARCMDSRSFPADGICGRGIRVTRTGCAFSLVAIHTSRKLVPSSFQRNATALLSADQTKPFGAVPIAQGRMYRRLMSSLSAAAVDVVKKIRTLVSRFTGGESPPSLQEFCCH